MVTSSSALLLEAQNVSFCIKGHLIIEDISLRLEKGSVTGLLGQNGAGKTTLLNCLSGCVEPTSGHVLLKGQSIFQDTDTKRKIGYLPDTPALHENFTVTEQLQFAAGLYQVKSQQRNPWVADAMQACHLTKLSRRIIGQLSRGQRQRVGIAQSIVHKPEVLIFDEPTEGLDPVQIQSFRKLISELSKNHAIILSSHLLHEVERMCNRISVLQNGRLIYQQDNLRFNQKIKLIFKTDIDDQQIAQCSAVDSINQAEGSTYIVDAENIEQASKEIVALCANNSWPLVEMKGNHTDLEARFFNQETST